MKGGKLWKHCLLVIRANAVADALPHGPRLGGEQRAVEHVRWHRGEGLDPVAGAGGLELAANGRRRAATPTNHVLPADLAAPDRATPPPPPVPDTPESRPDPGDDPDAGLWWSTI